MDLRVVEGSVACIGSSFNLFSERSISLLGRRFRLLRVATSSDSRNRLLFRRCRLQTVFKLLPLSSLFWSAVSCLTMTLVAGVENRCSSTVSSSS